MITNNPTRRQASGWGTPNMPLPTSCTSGVEARASGGRLIPRLGRQANLFFALRAIQVVLVDPARHLQFNLSVVRQVA